MPFFEIKYEITSIDNPPLKDSNLNEDQKKNSYKIHVTVAGWDKLSKEKQKELSDDYFPEKLDLTKPEIKTFLYYYVAPDHGKFFKNYFYKNYTEEQIKDIPSWKQATNFFNLIKCSDTVKIDEKLVIDGHNEKPVLKIIPKTEENPDMNTIDGIHLNDHKVVPNTYIITYNDKTKEEITLYSTDENNNYTTSLPNPQKSLLKKCINGVCDFFRFGGAKTKHHKKRKCKSKTRKRRKSKRHINKLK